MMHPHLPRYIKAITLIPILLLLLMTYYFVFYKNQHEIYGEHKIIENVQAMLLLTTCLIFIAISIYMERWKSYFSLPFALLCFSFLLREVDTERLELPHFITLITSGSGRTLLLVILWLATIACLLLYYSIYKTSIRHYQRSISARFLLICTAFLFMSYLFDKHASFFSYRLVAEETVEVCAYYLLMLSALTMPESLKHEIMPANAKPHSKVKSIAKPHCK